MHLHKALLSKMGHFHFLCLLLFSMIQVIAVMPLETRRTLNSQLLVLLFFQFWVSFVHALLKIYSIDFRQQCSFLLNKYLVSAGISNKGAMLCEMIKSKSKLYNIVKGKGLQDINASAVIPKHDSYSEATEVSNVSLQRCSAHVINGSSSLKKQPRTRVIRTRISVSFYNILFLIFHVLVILLFVLVCPCMCYLFLQIKETINLLVSCMSIILEIYNVYGT